MADTYEAFYNGKPLNSNRGLPTMSYAQAEDCGLTDSDRLWCCTDGEGTIITADQVPYDSNNSVKDMLTPVDISSSITINTTYIDDTSGNTDIKGLKMGKLVIINIAGMTLKSALSGSPVILSNLPAPKADINVGLTNNLYGGTSTDGYKVSRYRLRTTGELQLWYDGVPQNAVPFGQIVYFTN